MLISMAISDLGFVTWSLRFLSDALLEPDRAEDVRPFWPILESVGLLSMRLANI